MTVHIDMVPMEALDKFYDGETLGVYEGDFIKNEKQRGLKLPKLLREFLAKYGYLNVNRGANQIWTPDKIDTDLAKVDGKLTDILIIGKLRNNLIALVTDECNQENPIILMDDLPEEDGENITLVFHHSDLTLQEYLALMFVESPSVYDNSEVYSNKEAILEAIHKNSGDDADKIIDALKNGKRPGRHICWNEDENRFIVAILAPDRDVLVVFTPCFAIQELESLFSKEFYENSLHCDFGHALKLLQKLINHFESYNDMSLGLGEKYKLAGRCCWALKRWNEAEAYYKQAEKIYKDEMARIVDSTKSFYEGLGNFYFDREDIYKSQAAYDEADRLGEFRGEKQARAKGNRLIRQAELLVDANQYEKAIELYNQALEIYQTDPKDCKYDIARCQQLRGDARKALKDKQKQVKT